MNVTAIWCQFVSAIVLETVSPVAIGAKRQLVVGIEIELFTAALPEWCCRTC